MILLYALLGLLMGGLVNGLADTLPRERRPARPQCPYCGLPRPPTDWLAVVSYLLGRGRCPACTAPIPLRSVVVELSLALGFAYLYGLYGPTLHLLLVSLYGVILALITVIDLEHRLVLNVVILPAILLALVTAPLLPAMTWKRVLVGGLVGFLFFYLAALAYPGGMGAGDVKLAAFIGLISGFPGVVVALLVTLFAGGFVSLLLLLTRLRSLKDPIPYGPFLVVGGLTALLYGQQIVAWYLARAGV